MTDLPGYLLFRGLAGVVGLLPESAVRRLGAFLGFAGSFVSRRKSALLKRHLGRVLGSTPDLDRRVRRMFASYGRYWAEVFWVRPRRKAAIVSHARVDGTAHLTAAREAGKGIILALPHLGNWEAAGAKAENIGIPVLAVAEALPNARLIDWFVEVRRSLGIEVVLTGTGRRVTEALMRRLKDGGTVALLADRDLTGGGVDVEFFGERTTIPGGPAALAERTGAALLPVGCYFNRGRGHTFVVHEPVAVPMTGTRQERVAGAAQSLAGVMEEIIRAAPEQWHLFQPNWPSDKKGAVRE